MFLPLDLFFLTLQYRNLPSHCLEPLIDALLEQIPEDSGSTVITVKTDNIPLSQANGQKHRQSTATYDPALVYVLEFATLLALRDASTIELFGKRVVDALQTVLRDVPRHHPIVIERATFYLLSLLHASYVSADMADVISFFFIMLTNKFYRTTTIFGSLSFYTPSPASRTISCSRRLDSCCAA
jgi:hypothetical protein